MASKKKQTKKTDSNAFIQRKLLAFNAISGSKETRARAEKAMTRIISKNKGGLA